VRVSANAGYHSSKSACAVFCGSVECSVVGYPTTNGANTEYHKPIGVAADGVDCAAVECLKVPSKQTHTLHRKSKTVAAQVALRHAVNMRKCEMPLPVRCPITQSPTRHTHTQHTNTQRPTPPPPPPARPHEDTACTHARGRPIKTDEKRHPNYKSALPLLARWRTQTGEIAFAPRPSTMLAPCRYSRSASCLSQHGTATKAAVDDEAAASA
jgi:hypothetical protein